MEADRHSAAGSSGKRGYVYFIRAAESGMVKIGRATNPERRLAALQSASHETLTIIRLEACGNPQRRERELHQRFSEWRRRGEWFEVGLPLLRLLGNPPRITDDERRRLTERAAAKVQRWRAA